MTSDPLTAVLDQLAAHREQLTGIDAREARHFATLSEQLTRLASLVATVGQALADDTGAITRIEALEHAVTSLAAAKAAADDDGHQPGPSPAWWKLTGTERQEAAAPLRAWVTQVYRPGYGHLAATLGPCWEAHDLCLYGLDLLAQLWSALYLQPARSTGVLSAQAEYQARILPALAAQLAAETTGCRHDPARSHPGYPRSMP